MNAITTRSNPPQQTSSIHCFRSNALLLFFQIFKDQTEPKAPLKHSHLVKALNRNLGGDKRDRTVDPLLAKQVLSQLSYAPVCQSYRGGS